MQLSPGACAALLQSKLQLMSVCQLALVLQLVPVCQLAKASKHLLNFSLIGRASAGLTWPNAEQLRKKSRLPLNFQAPS